MSKHHNISFITSPKHWWRISLAVKNLRGKIDLNSKKYILDSIDNKNVEVINRYKCSVSKIIHRKWVEELKYQSI